MNKIARKSSLPKSKQRRFGPVFVIIMLLLAGVVYVFWHDANKNKLIAPNGTKMTTEIRDDSAERSQGLSGRSSLADDQAMLFVFPSEQDGLCFWMKEMNFDIDMIWLNSNKEVVYVKQGVEPESYPEKFCPGQPSQYVIEVNSDQAAQRGFVIGAQVSF